MFNKLFAAFLLVNDFDKSLAFYKDLLGLEVKKIEGKFAIFNLEGTLLEIVEKGEAVAMFPREHMGQGGGVILSFQAEDVQKTCEELKVKGVEIFEGPKATAWGESVAYFKDPDGNILEISSG